MSYNKCNNNNGNNYHNNNNFIQIFPPPPWALVLDVLNSKHSHVLVDPMHNVGPVVVPAVCVPLRMQ